MRKHGWQLPHHPLQVVAVAVFLALGFAFYVFFAPFVGKKMYQYTVMSIYTPLITCAFGLYIWCAAADPADPGVFRSKKYLKVPENAKQPKQQMGSKLGEESASSMHNGSVGGKSQDTSTYGTNSALKDPNCGMENKNVSSERSLCLQLLCFPCAFIYNCCGARDESSEQQMSEDGMFYCSLCEVEVFKNSKHCRVCDKCVDGFDHHCRWLNNCIGKRNYRQFFILMVSAVLLIILQWSIGILVLVRCFLERKHFSAFISAKLGSSFSLVPFVIVVALCTGLAMIATLPLAQLFFFHILLIKKGISTYDYIVALREQEQEQEQGVGGQQSPQMSQVSSITGLSSASSFSAFHRGGAAWCTPPRLFLEDQFDVVPPENASVSSYGKSSYGKKAVREEPVKKKNAPVKISPWALARLNAEEVSRAAAEARKKSKILQPVTRRDAAPFRLEATTSFGRRTLPRPESDSNDKRRAGRRERIRIPAGLSQESLTTASAKAPPIGFPETSSSFAPLQLEARSAFQTSRAMSSSGGVVAASSSPESSVDSPEIHPFRLSSSGAEESRRHSGLIPTGLPDQAGIPFSRSNSDGYEASGGEDSDRVPSRSVHRSTNWSNLLSDPDHEDWAARMTRQFPGRQ